MSKRDRILDGIPQPMSVLYMAAEIGDPRVEDIAERILPKEEIAQYPSASGILVVDP